MNTVLAPQVFGQLQQELVLQGSQSMVENIKILLYQTDESIFDWVDFDNDDIYQEPLLFAYFNAENKEDYSLESILYGYSKSELRPKSISVLSDEFGRVYLPKIGWLKTNEPNQRYDFSNYDNKIELRFNVTIVEFILESIDLIEDTNIELVKYSIPLLKQCYFDTEENLIEVEIEKITLSQKKNLEKAFNLIKTHIPEHFKLIELVTKKCVIFNVETHLRNSFAIMSAQGTGFFNSYQDTYNEVFFVDDIVHQTGHVIFNAMIYDAERFIIPDPNSVLQRLRLRHNNEVETRSISVVFHAMYTYYTTFIALDACLDANVFEGHKRHEALGRIAFYVGKCYQDVLSIDLSLDNEDGSRELFTDEGMEIYFEIKTTLKYMLKKWGAIIKKFNLEYQPYNFTYSKFLEFNPLL